MRDKDAGVTKGGIVWEELREEISDRDAPSSKYKLKMKY